MSRGFLFDSSEVIRPLQQCEKQSRRLVYDEIPTNIHLEGQSWDLSSWTLIMQDSCLCRLVERQDVHHLKELKLSGADKITDVGLKAIAKNVPNLSSCSIENAFLITEKGLATLVKCCQKLKKLNISGCLGISGTDFAILGQHACNLVELEVSGCRQITSWAFMKIFEGCRSLKCLDVSHCSTINDPGIKILADSCVEMERLNIQGCSQVSDVGILSLSKKVINLSMITMSRTDLISRITDVSLLAIAEGCPILNSIDISGCEMVSDVGISWLSKGCKNLECVNFTNCVKITNVGLRYLSEECKALRVVILKNVKQVSDVGLRYLANGCSQLESLNASGLCLITDGVHRDFGHEGLQSLAGSMSKNSLKKLNLHGCFRICKNSIKTLSSMKNLDKLVLSSCSSLSPKEMLALFKSCFHLTTLSLATCGECITDSILESIGANLKNLKVLDITDSFKVGRRGLRGLSYCTTLVSLNLSGCKRISNEAILCLGEGNFQPGIRELYLNDCLKLDDTALTWITDSFKDRNLLSGSVTLVTLALKGTKVTHRALIAVQSYFQYSSIKKNLAFFGFFALSRAQDRRSINEHSREAHYVALIQAIFRARRSRLEVSEIRERHRKAHMATKLTASWRGWFARSLARKYRHERRCRRSAAVRLQCFVRVMLARAVVTKLHYRQWRLKAPIMATMIQRVFRGYRGRTLALHMFESKIETQRQLDLSSIRIQNIARMHIALQKVKFLRGVAASMKEIKIACCVRIQKMWRSELARREMNEHRLQLFLSWKKESRASNSIVRMIRCHIFRLCVHKKVLRKTLLRDNALKIQRWYRDVREATKAKALEKLRIATFRNGMAVKIQSFARRWLAKLKLHRLRVDKEKLESFLVKKATIITSWSRMQLAKVSALRLKKQRDLELKQRHAIETGAATQIETLCRGFLGRKISQQMVEQSRSRWKQMWSDEERIYFYHNQITGESRWEKPRELLELEMRPICSNCNFWDAQVECSNCDEFFCKTCWDAVHYGGKRKSHLFRSIYDYYNRRIDYTYVNDYPSLWPNELNLNMTSS